jgi:hypothetical protein
MLMMSLYSLIPLKKDLKVTIEIMSIFAEASGLFTNIRKAECYPIQCEGLDLSFLNDSNIILSHFPCKYLSLPIHFKKPTRSMLQPVIEKVGKRLSRWKKDSSLTLEENCW